MKNVSYGHSRRLTKLGFDRAVETVTAELKREGFGVLTEIDVKGTLKKKLGVDFPRYKILGACNPQLAHQALTAEPEIGLLLPCNVVVAEEDDGQASVAIISPKEMFKLVDNPYLADVADQVEAKMRRVIDRLE